MSLEYELSLPEKPADGAPVIILLHGRGSDRHDLLGLRSGFPAEAIVVAPQAPFPAAPWGYGPGWAWYRFLGGTRPEPDSFLESQSRLTTFLDDLPELLGLCPGRVLLGGFSQGGTMSLAFGLREPGRAHDIVNLSGFLADHPEVRVTPETVSGMRFFWGHWTQDPNIPFAHAEAGWRALREAGAELDARSYPTGHWIAPEELHALAEWIRSGPQADPSTGRTP
jgi:phospholipase/carboxylesterase